MRNVSPIFFAGDDFADDDIENGSFDDIDHIFGHLEQFDPPANMVQRIMDAVSTLPSYPVEQGPSQTEHDTEGLVVRYEKQKPS
ncbi:MAG TPA: hypothetical protein VL461_03950 [Dictyobacter sp.]|jgi:hypothetical protein|nr:hypothetical protein [Dictyobacter sp.]